MAKETFVARQARVLVAAMQLTLGNSEDELKSAVARALDGWAPRRDIAVPWQNGESENYAHYAHRRIFPVWVKMPDESGTGWVNSHKWGEGSNEGAESILGEVKIEVVRMSGLPSWRFSWEQAKEWGVETLLEISEALKCTESGRGKCSPYTQDYEKEFELALRFGPEILVRWHASMHFKGWAEFVNHIHALWKRWGTEGILQIDQECGNRIRWFAEFATQQSWEDSQQKSVVPEYFHFRYAVELWKRSGRFHAVTKIKSPDLARLDRELGYRRVNDLLRLNEKQINELPEDLRAIGFGCLAQNDAVEWIPAFVKDRLSERSDWAHQVIEVAKDVRIKPSVFAAEVANIMDTSSMRWETICTCLCATISELATRI